MKIIDFELLGNVVKFYLGKDDLQEFYGDDWDDAPYDCNAGEVYPEQLHMLLSKLRDANPSITLFALPDQYYLEGMDVQQLKNIRNYIDELIASSNFDTFAGMGIQT